jgi:C1A family cysteine protease
MKNLSKIPFKLQRQAHDPKDRVFSASPTFALNVPNLVDFRSLFPPIFNQKNLGSCALQAAVSIFMFLRRNKQGGVFQVLSRLFLYWVTRRRMDTLNEDSGVDLRNLLKSFQQDGTCRDSLWKYIISYFTKEPPKSAFSDAKNNRIVSYDAVANNNNALMLALASGRPVLFGMDIFSSMLSESVAKSGIVPMPSEKERSEGGHAMAIVGYDKAREVYFVRNSWGKEWGKDGYCEMSFELIHQHGWDFWTMTV